MLTQAQFATALTAQMVRDGKRPLRPGWLTDDREWTEQLRAMCPSDVDWFAQQWELAGGGPPSLDTSWLTRERIR